jgi:DNA-binding transcriptional regulator YiaG
MKTMTKTTRRPASSPALLLLSTVGTNKGLDIKAFCQAYAVPQQTFTRLTGFSPRAVSGWANGEPRTPSTERRLAETQRLFTALAKLVKATAIGPWLETANPAFGGSTPVQVIERGETDRLWRMIYELESGQPG